MKAVVTGSSGHLGEALIRTLRAQGKEVLGLDLVTGAFTSEIREDRLASEALLR
ncbi:MAG: hypothetical protein U1F61_06610 [Opitutaceae bacterium]